MDERREGSGRRNFDDWQESIRAQLVNLVTSQQATQLTLANLNKQVEEDVGELKNDVDDLKEFLRGGLNGSDSIETRLRDIEKVGRELSAVVLGNRATGEGGVLGMVKLSKERLEDLEQAQKIQMEKRGQNISVILSALALVGTITTATLLNLDKLKGFFKTDERPFAARIQDEVIAQRAAKIAADKAERRKERQRRDEDD